MKLDQLKPNFSTMSQEEQEDFINRYRDRRHYDLIETTVVKVNTKGKRKTAEKKITITAEAHELLKKLGLV